MKNTAFITAVIIGITLLILGLFSGLERRINDLQEQLQDLNVKVRLLHAPLVK